MELTLLRASNIFSFQASFVYFPFNTYFLYFVSTYTLPRERSRSERSRVLRSAKHISLVKERINHPKELLSLALHAGVIVGLILISGDLGVALVYIGFLLCQVITPQISFSILTHTFNLFNQ